MIVCPDGSDCPAGSVAPNFPPAPPVPQTEEHCFCVSAAVIAPILSVVSLIVLHGIVVHLDQSKDQERLAWAFFVLLSWANLLTDILYVTRSDFKSEAIQWASLIFILIPLVPGLFVLRPQWSHIGKHYSYTHPCGENIFAALPNLLYNVLKVLVHTAVLIGGFGVSVFLYAIKLFSSVPYATPWFNLWNPEFAASWSSVVLPEYHLSIVLEIILQTIPQIVIQLSNNGSDWSSIAIASMVFCVLILVCHLWKYLYFILIKGAQLSEIPIGFSLTPRTNKAVPRPESKASALELPSSAQDISSNP